MNFTNISRLTIAAATVLLGASLCAQNDTYVIKSGFKIEGLPPEYAGFGDQDITSFVKGDKSKTEMTGMMGTTTMYFDGKSMTTLVDNMGNKSGFTASTEELEAEEKKNGGQQKPVIEYVDEKKQIAGYDCSKAIATVTGKDKKESKMVIWYTDKLKFNPKSAKARSRGMADLSELKGYPLGVEQTSTEGPGGGELKITIFATEVSTNPVDDSVFNFTTDGYNMMTYKDYNDKQKAMRQGGK